MTNLLTYGNIRLADIHAQKPENWDLQDATHIRVTLPASSENIIKMQEKGFLLADRTLGVSINLNRAGTELEKYVRMEIRETSGYRKEIFQIAKTSFQDDRRFHILPHFDSDVADCILADWVKDLNNCLVCFYKESVIGFLDLEEEEPDKQCIHLAAIQERYRATGAALSLYAKAVSLCKKRGYKKIEGRISSKNIAVMNLYTFLSGTFFSPEDIYLKEVISCDT